MGQVAMVIDLNKCIGCQTCTIACKRLWTRDEGMEYMWWNTVNTQPGLGTPRNWENLGGGFENGVAKPGQDFRKLSRVRLDDFAKKARAFGRSAAGSPGGNNKDSKDGEGQAKS